MHCQFKRCSFIILSVFFLFACAKEAPPPALVEVVVDTVRLQEFKPNISFVGRLKARDDVSIQAQVSGYLESRYFTEGEMVNKGALLYVIDPAQFEARLASARATLAKANAAKQVADRNFNRGQELGPRGAISEAELDTLLAKKLEADADLQAARAGMKSAEVDLSYTKIHAPIRGRIGSSAYSSGDLIGPESGALTSLVSIDPIMATFQISESAYLISEHRRQQMMTDQAELDSNRLPNIVARLEMANREFYQLSGELDYISNRIDEATGTIEARAIFPNPKGLLRPGQYVHVRLEMPSTINVLMLPQSAVQADQQGNFVLVVGLDNKVQRRNVELDNRVNEFVVVKHGVEEGEKIIVKGLQKVRPGQLVALQSLKNTADSQTEGG